MSPEIVDQDISVNSPVRNRWVYKSEHSELLIYLLIIENLCHYRNNADDDGDIFHSPLQSPIPALRNNRVRAVNNGDVRKLERLRILAKNRANDAIKECFLGKKLENDHVKARYGADGRPIVKIKCPYKACADERRKFVITVDEPRNQAADYTCQVNHFVTHLRREHQKRFQWAIRSMFYVIIHLIFVFLLIHF